MSTQVVSVLFLFFFITKYTEAVKYTVSVKTGTKYKVLEGPGTDCEVKVKIYGKSRKTGLPASTGEIKLKKSAEHSNKFEKGNTDTFVVNSAEDLIFINEVQVKIYSCMFSPVWRWLLDKITVKTEKGDGYDFTANTWLEKKDVYHSVKNLVSGVVYNIIMYTGSVVKSGSRAQVFITLMGSKMTSSEIHLKSSAPESSFLASNSKIYQVQIEDVGRLLKIRIRQDVSGASPNWKLEKVFIVAEYDRIYEFLISTWLDVTQPFQSSVIDDYSATSLKFISYPDCIQPVESKMHPTPNSAVILSKPCGALANFFKLHPDGVLQHIASGMCIHGSDNKKDPRYTKHGDGLRLNYPCILYRPGAGTPHALQFKFTSGGSLMEAKSGNCISSNKGQPNLALTFSKICDTEDTKIGFIDKNNQVLFPKRVGKSPAKTPSIPSPPSPIPAPPSPTPAPSSPTPAPPSPTLAPPSPPSSPTSVPQSPISPPSTPSKTDNAQPVTQPGNFGSPVYCPSTCGSSSCMPTCQPLCCSGPGAMPAGYPTVIRCSPSCSPGQCRSECPVGCCFPNLVSWNDEQYDENGDSNTDNDRKR